VTSKTGVAQDTALAARPNGMSTTGVDVGAAGVAAAGPGTRTGRTGRIVGLAVMIVIVVGVHNLASERWIDITNLAFMAAIAAIGLDLVLGHTGLVSVGNAAFLAIGATTVALLNLNRATPMLLSLLIAGAVCAVVGLVVAVPSLRISGLYLAVATLAFHFIALWAIRKIQADKVGDSGFVIPPARVFGIELFELRTWYVFLAITLGLVLAFHRSLLLRKPGRSLHTIRERPALAAMSGISVWKYKVGAFAISSFLIGVAGGLQAYYIGNVSYANFSLSMSIEYLAMVIVGGLGSTYGAVVGAWFVVSLPYFVRDARDKFHLDKHISPTDINFYQASLVGVVVVLVIIFQPRGLAAMGSSIRDFIAKRIRRDR
jgi:branched-chain amino acid transport system permease protein